MDDARRYDRPAAVVAMVTNRSNGGKANMIDFLPYQPKKEDGTIESFDQLMGILESVKR